MRDASRQARKLCPEDLMDYSFIIQGKWGLEKPASSFLGVVVSPWYPVRCVFNHQKGGSQTPALSLNLNAGRIPSPTQRHEAILTPPLVKQACLVLMAFLSNLLTYSDLPNPAGFPSLCMILYWDCYKHLCLFHPYHPHAPRELWPSLCAGLSTHAPSCRPFPDQPQSKSSSILYATCFFSHADPFFHTHAYVASCARPSLPRD